MTKSFYIADCASSYKDAGTRITAIKKRNFFLVEKSSFNLSKNPTFPSTKLYFNTFGITIQLFGVLDQLLDEKFLHSRYFF